MEAVTKVTAAMLPTPVITFSNKKSIRYFFPRAKYASSRFFFVAPANLWPNSKKGYFSTVAAKIKTRAI